MYIGKVEVTNEWQKLDALIQAQVDGQSAFTFDSAVTYQIQGEGNYGIRLCEVADAPTDPKVGLRIRGVQPAHFKVDSGYDLYVKVEDGENPARPLLHISTIGEE
jgi:hypothetical protein